ncbi:MAG: Gfo/Idh/MocA family oxidoreductase [Cyclobacteriaceae bacterium]|nr:Gfo/Idh/MocA family oxidoreductase [Cyclobacteriaceae bacterium]
MKENRRGFIKKAAGSALAMIAAPYIIPGTALGKNGALAPSERIVFGGIGLGSQGMGNSRGFLNKKEIQYVAICDVDARHRNNAMAMINGTYQNNDCRSYGDYREMLEKEKLDAITIAVPDHWHALISTAVANKGIDIYGEKPLARSIKEARAIVNAVNKNNVIWQTGSWQRSLANFHRGAELVINGRVGKVTHVEVGLPNGRKPIGTPPPMPLPEGLDWEMWLGPAPAVPYRGVAHWDWRWIMDYSGGQLTDWAGHHIDIAHWGLGYDKTGPISIEGVGVYPREGIFDVPIAYDFICEYKTGVTMRVANASKQKHGMGTVWHGDKGWVHVDRGDVIRASDPKILEEVIGKDEIQLYKSTDHQQNFIDCIRSREETITPAETAHRSISVGLLGEIAMLTGKKLAWDPEQELITNSAYANRLLVRPYRNPWKLDMIS